VFRTDVAVQSLRPTLLATPLRPLVAITVGLLSIAVVSSWRGVSTSDLLGAVASGALAAGVALGLDDEAHSSLRSSPTAAPVRLAHRLFILIPALLAALGVLAAADRVLFVERSVRSSPLGLAALVAAGVAVDVWWSRRWPATAAEGAAVVVVGWSLAGSFTPDMWFIQRLVEAWDVDAPWLLVSSLVLVITGCAGRSA
jgi:hypothetical protein